MAGTATRTVRTSGARGLASVWVSLSDTVSAGHGTHGTGIHGMARGTTARTGLDMVHGGLGDQVGILGGRATGHGDHTGLGQL